MNQCHILLFLSSVSLAYSFRPYLPHLKCHLCHSTLIWFTIGLNSITIPPVLRASCSAFSLSRVLQASCWLLLHRKSVLYNILPTKYSPFFLMIRHVFFRISSFIKPHFRFPAVQLQRCRPVLHHVFLPVREGAANHRAVQ